MITLTQQATVETTHRELVDYHENTSYRCRLPPRDPGWIQLTVDLPLGQHTYPAGTYGVLFEHARPVFMKPRPGERGPRAPRPHWRYRWSCEESLLPAPPDEQDTAAFKAWSFNTDLSRWMFKQLQRRWAQTAERLQLGLSPIRDDYLHQRLVLINGQAHRISGHEIAACSAPELASRVAAPPRRPTPTTAPNNREALIDWLIASEVPGWPRERRSRILVIGERKRTPRPRVKGEPPPVDPVTAFVERMPPHVQLVAFAERGVATTAITAAHRMGLSYEVAIRERPGTVQDGPLANLPTLAASCDHVAAFLRGTPSQAQRDLDTIRALDLGQGLPIHTYSEADQ